MGHKILLADDSITIQKVIELTFSDEDFELHTVGNGQKAIEEIRAIQPDIVLCDIIMPEKNGYEVCEFIKSTDELKHIPVLLLTGAFEPFDQERAKAAGCEGFLAKPFEPQTLISKVKELLAGAQGAAASPAATSAAPQPAAPQPAAPVQADPFMPQEESDETVLAPPPSMGGRQVPATPAPPPPAPQEGSSGLDEQFAVEAGERELAMDPGDHTMLLGANDSPNVPAPPTPAPSASDDIWNDVNSAPPAPPEPTPPAEQDEGATVFMAEPPPMAPPGGPVDNEMSVASEDPDATWQVPQEPPPASPTPGDEFGGFEDFAAPAQSETPPEAEPPSLEMPAEIEPPPFQDEPPATPSASPELGDPLSPEPPELGSTNEVSPIEVNPEPIPSVDTQSTMDPVRAGQDAFAPLSTTSEPPAPEPSSVSEGPSPSAGPEPTFTPVEPPNELPSFDDASPPAASTPEPPPLEAEPITAGEAPPMMEMGSEPPAASREPSVPAVTTDDDLVERVAQRVVDKLSSKVIQEIAWEVVPDLAEGLIQREIDVLKSKMPKSG